MIDAAYLAAVLDSLKEPILVADTGHITRYMNKAALTHYEGGSALIGRSLLECHSKQSQEIMIEILAAMRDGLEERLIADKDRYRVYMRAVRNADGELLGYYERYESKG